MIKNIQSCLQCKTKIEFYNANGKKIHLHAHVCVSSMNVLREKKVLIRQYKEFPFVRNIYFNFDNLGTSQSST